MSTDGVMSTVYSFSEGNVSNEENLESCNYYIPTPAVIAIILVILGFILLVGIVGNILVIIVIAAVKSMHTTVNKCLFSLAVADLVLLCFLPIQPVTELLTVYHIHLIPESLCHFLNLYDRGAGVCSVLNFFYVTIDRYFAICYPLKSRALWTQRKTYVILILIWVASFVLSYPYFHFSVYYEFLSMNVTHSSCDTNNPPWMAWYDNSLSIVFFYIPLPVLIMLNGKMIYRIRAFVPQSESDQDPDGANGRRKRGQVVVFMLIIVGIYILTQLPLRIFIFLNSATEANPCFPFDRMDFAIAWLFRLLLYVNSAANPVVYFCVSTNFRQGFKQVFCSFTRKKVNAHQKRFAAGT